MGSSNGTSSAEDSGFKIIEEAERWLGTPYRLGGESRAGVDCSHFVHAVYAGRGLKFPYTGTREFPPSGYFRRLAFGETPIAGDVVLFNGHMGLVGNRGNWNLISAQGNASRPVGVRYGRTEWFGSTRGIFRWAHRN